MTSRETCFLCFVQHGERLKKFLRLFRIKASEILEKSSTGAIYKKKKMEKRGQKELLTTLECLNYKKSSQQLPSCFIAMRDSPFCKMFSPLFCFEQEKTLKNCSKKQYTVQLRDWSKIIEGGGPEQRGVGHEVLSLVQGVGLAICSYP